MAQLQSSLAEREGQVQQLESDLQAQRQDNVQLKEQVDPPHRIFRSLKRMSSAPAPHSSVSVAFTANLPPSPSSSFHFLPSTSSLNFLPSTSLPFPLPSSSR